MYDRNSQSAIFQPYPHEDVLQLPLLGLRQRDERGRELELRGGLGGCCGLARGRDAPRRGGGGGAGGELALVVVVVAGDGNGLDLRKIKKKS